MRAEEKMKLQPDNPWSAAKPDIIASGPLMRGENMEPIRAVLRRNGADYVVHTQVIPDEDRAPSYTDGRYFTTDQAAAAVAAFTGRVMNLLNGNTIA